MLAEKVQAIVGTEPRPNDDYWAMATRGELFLIQKNYADAARLYQAAMAAARSERGSHQSTWLKACRLMAKLQPTEHERELLRNVFKSLKDCSELPVE